MHEMSPGSATARKHSPAFFLGIAPDHEPAQGHRLWTHGSGTHLSHRVPEPRLPQEPYPGPKPAGRETLQPGQRRFSRPEHLPRRPSAARSSVVGAPAIVAQADQQNRCVDGWTTGRGRSGESRLAGTAALFVDKKQC